MKPNIGLINSFVRMTCGFMMLAWATSRMVRKPYREVYPFLGLMAAMKIAEGITRFCPLTAFLEDFIKKVNEEQTNSQETNRYNSATKDY